MAASSIQDLNARSLRRTHEFFGGASSESFLASVMPSAKKQKLSELDATSDTINAGEIKLSSRILSIYGHVKDLPAPGSAKKNESATQFLNRTASKSSTESTAQVSDAVDDDTSNAIQSAVSKLATTVAFSSSTESNALIRSTATSSGPTSALAKLGVNREAAGVPWEDEKPTWHAPWEMKTVITGGHLGWVRTVTVDPTNSWFATGAADRTIKIWDLAARKLKLTLTGHVAGVRSLVASERHPYLFSAGEDRQVFCWDLESNKAIRHYFGHNAGVYTMALHPELDLLVTGSRDRSVKVWDLRSRAAVFTWHNHTATVHTVAAQATEPQIMSGSADSTIRLWDLVAGKTRTTLTNHSKGVRDLLLHPTENTMLSAGADNIKRWKFPDGNFMNNYEHNAGTIQALAINHENVFVSASDNGKLQFWDYRTAHCFQATETIAQPGSVSSEMGIFDLAFDRTGSRLITCEADKTIKIWAEVQDATPTTHPLNWKAKRRKTQW